VPPPQDAVEAAVPVVGEDDAPLPTVGGVDRSIAISLTWAFAWTGIVIAIVAIPVVLSFSPEVPRRLLICGCAGAIGAAGLWLLARGRVAWAAYGQLWAYWTLMACATLLNGGVAAPALSTSILLTVYATLAIGIRHALALCAATLALSLLLIYREHHGQAPVPVPSELRATLYVVLSVMAARMLWITTSILNDAVARARAETARRAEVVVQLRTSQAQLRLLNLELEQRVLERTRQLSSTNEELQAFSYAVAHDLRAPLRAINGFSTEVLEESRTVLSAQSLSDLERINGASRAMDVLIDGLLMLSRLTRQDLHFQHVDLSALAGEVLAGLRLTEPQREVAVEIAPELAAVGDALLLRILLDNLIGNAWKYTGRSANARIRFASEVVDGVRTFILQDNGAGFDMAYASKLFGAFQRLHTRGDFTGTGIGLATARRIVSRHGGRIWAEGAVGQGARFWFTLGDHPLPPAVVPSPV
jgi:signal transduction histidine kinase